MTKRYSEYYIDAQDGTIYLSEDQIKEVLNSFLPDRPKLLCEKIELGCEKGHTYRQIMGFEALDCECCND